MTDSTIQIALNTTGPLVDVQNLLNGSLATVSRQTITVGDPTNIAGIQTVHVGGVLATSADAGAVVQIRPDGGGSTGSNVSANAPTWPRIGNNFATGGLFPSWVLLTTVPANQSRCKVTVDNQSNDQILCLRDDGTAATGAAPVNPTGFTINPKASAGPEGGHFESTTFRGRLQIFGVSASQFVAVSTD
jgi:hypothetical protein